MAKRGGTFSARGSATRKGKRGGTNSYSGGTTMSNTGRMGAFLRHGTTKSRLTTAGGSVKAR